MNALRPHPFMLGVAARIHSLESRDLERMKAAGIGWLRLGDFGFDARAFLEDRPQGESFERNRRKVGELIDAGFQIMGLTPGPRDLGDAIGTPGSAAYFENYRRIHAWFGRELGGIIQWWQVANELDIWIFRAGLSLEQSVTLLKTGIRGLKETAPQTRAGINITLYPSRPGEVDGNTDAHEGLTLATGIYGDPSLPVDYAGFDSYPGTWREGGPESWSEYLDGFHALTGKPIIVQEFGYASAGGIMTPAEAAAGRYPCEVKKWRFAWRNEHSQQTQADYLAESLRIFVGKPFVLGATCFNWRDAETCWQCRQPDCPAETAWGLIDRAGNPKLAYHSFRRTAESLFGPSQLISHS